MDFPGPCVISEEEFEELQRGEHGGYSRARVDRFLRRVSAELEEVDVVKLWLSVAFVNPGVNLPTQAALVQGGGRPGLISVWYGMSAWERANAVYGLVEVISKTVAKSARRLAKAAREEDGE